MLYSTFGGNTPLLFKRYKIKPFHEKFGLFVGNTVCASTPELRLVTVPRGSSSPDCSNESESYNMAIASYPHVAASSLGRRDK